MNSVTGALEAAYEYDPSGNLLRCEGSYAKSNPFRFSTKWQDDETGLINYGVRYFSPTLGRFINRDPIGEKGGLNLYGFCGNDAANGIDYLGLDPEVLVLDKFVTVGSQVGSAFGPVGTVVGAAVGAVIGVVFGKLLGGLFGFGGGSRLPPKPKSIKQAPAQNGTQVPAQNNARVIRGMWQNPDPFNPDHFTHLGDGTWIENVGQGTGWYGQTIQLEPLKITATRGIKWSVAIPEFLTGLAKGAAIGIASGVAICTLVAVAPATLPVVVGLGGAALIKSAYDWASDGYQVTPKGVGEVIGGLAGGGIGGRLGGTLGRYGRTALQEMLKSTSAAESATVRTLTAAEKKLYGPVTRPAGFKETVWNMNKGADGLVRDPTGKIMRFDEPWELGHVPGNKAADMRIWAAEQGMDRATWIKVQNDPYIYRPELPGTNSGHLWEFTW